MAQIISEHKQNKLATLIAVVGVLLLMVVVWSWWHFIRSDVERTFFAALDANLKTQYVTKQTIEEQYGQKLEQTARTSLGPEQLVGALTVISSQDGTNVQTETIGTPSVDYVRYKKIVAPGDSAAAADFNKVLNIWSKSESPDGSQTTGEMYGSTVLGVMPLGNVPVAQRQELLDFARKNRVYQFDETKVKREVKDGRPVYTYPVTVSMEDWVNLLKRFARNAHLTQLDGVDSAAYKDSQPLEITVTVDVWSRQFTAIDYGEERQERLGSYGVRPSLEVPKNSISMQELERRLAPAQ